MKKILVINGPNLNLLGLREPAIYGNRDYKALEAFVLESYTHTSVAILDALKAVAIPTVEVHLSDVDSREEFRRHSFVSLYASKVIKGKGFDGYREALEYFSGK